MRVPDEVRQCVVYLGLPGTGEDGQEVMLPKGTAFFVSIPCDNIQGSAHVYLVTAKHVARGLQSQQFIIRVNRTDGTAAFIRSGDARWWFHPTDELADIAVLPGAPAEFVDHRQVPSSMFLTDEIIRSKGIGTGDEVFITGLFIHLAGSARNLPIVRMGNIAMMPDEAVPTSIGSIDAYLIEARSIGGLSGSPAFVRETVSGRIGDFYLLGLMHGHWDIPLEARDDHAPSADEEGQGKVNMGIAVVVPASKILEVLNQPTLVQMRKSEEAHMAEQQQQSQNPPDSAGPSLQPPAPN